jgi:hypothetical protein
MIHVELHQVIEAYPVHVLASARKTVLFGFFRTGKDVEDVQVSRIRWIRII